MPVPVRSWDQGLQAAAPVPPRGGRCPAQANTAGQPGDGPGGGRLRRLLLDGGTGGRSPRSRGRMAPPWPAILIAVGAAGCATVGPGRLDGTTMREAATIPAQELEIRVDERGEVQKLAMEHGDASRIPAAVMKLVQEKLPGASPERYELELRPGTPATYEVEVKTKGGQHCEVAGLADGTFKYLECELPAAELPATITDWIKANHPGAAISEVETVKGPGVDEIAVEIKVGEALFALHFKASGELLRRCLVVPATIELPRP